jgi:hypothetical protein
MRPADGRIASAAAIVPAMTDTPSKAPGSRPVTMVPMAPIAVPAMTRQTPSPPCIEPHGLGRPEPLEPEEPRDPRDRPVRRRALGWVHPGSVRLGSVSDCAGIARVGWLA